MTRRTAFLALGAAVELGVGAGALTVLPAHPGWPHPAAPVATALAPASRPATATTTTTTKVKPRIKATGASVTPSPEAAASAPITPPITRAQATATTVAQSPTGTAAAASQAPPVPAVTCGTDLPLAQSPNVAYNFLCRAGTRPVTWDSARLTMYVSGLSAEQSAVFPAALAQWEQAGHFIVVLTSQRSAAEVVITGADLAATQPGYSEDGYTTVTWACTPSCHFTGAHVKLATQASLDSASWASTILHELGHVAGLNHVSRAGEVMYPVLAAGSPATYSAADTAGLAVLAAERTG